MLSGFWQEDFFPIDFWPKDFWLEYYIPDGWSLQITAADKLKFTLGNKDVDGAIAITDSNYHLAFIIVDRDGNAQIYLDNQPDGVPVDISDRAMSASNPLHIADDHNGANRFKGDIDIVEFFNKKLTQAERDFVFQSGRGTNALHEVLRPGFTSLIGKPRIEAASDSKPRMIATPSSKPRIEARPQSETRIEATLSSKPRIESGIESP